MTNNTLGLNSIIEHAATVAPDNNALVFQGRATSFAQLDARCNQLANGLINKGLKPQSRIAILDKNAPTFFDILFGAAKANIVLVTVNFRLTPLEIHYILDDADVELIFVGNDLLPSINTLLDTLPKLKHIIVLDQQGEYESWLTHCPSDPPKNVVQQPNDAVVQMYTSGTTGHPKGVELSHRAMINAAKQGDDVWPFLEEPDSKVLATMPLFHIAASNLCIAAFNALACAEIVRDIDLDTLANTIAEHGISLVPVPATLIHQMLRQDDIRNMDFSALKVMLIAGSGIAVELLKEAAQVFNCGFALSYGSTEMCGGVTYLGPASCTFDAGEKLKSAGTLLSHSEIKIVDPDGVELPYGKTGEIIVRSNRLMNGYWKRPDATAEAMRNGWFHSGDAGYMDEQGFLYVVDRLKDMVISGGENIYPVEIENVLHTHPAVEDVSVIGVPDDKWGETLVAVIIPKAGVTQPSAHEYIEFLRPILAGYKIPRRYELTKTFPTNAMGKVLKRTLREQFS